MSIMLQTLTQCNVFGIFRKPNLQMKFKSKFQIHFGNNLRKSREENGQIPIMGLKVAFKSRRKYITFFLSTRSQSVFSLTKLQILLRSHDPLGNKSSSLSCWKLIPSPGELNCTVSFHKKHSSGISYITDSDLNLIGFDCISSLFARLFLTHFHFPLFPTQRNISRTHAHTNTHTQK